MIFLYKSVKVEDDGMMYYFVVFVLKHNVFQQRNPC